MAENNIDIATRFMPRSTAMKLLAHSSRDNARTPFQWSGAPNAGFTTGTPWFTVNENYHEINAAAQEDDPNSLLNFYRQLLKFRKENPVALWGDYPRVFPQGQEFLCLRAQLRGQAAARDLLVSRAKLKRFDAPEGLRSGEGEAGLLQLREQLLSS